MDPRSGLDGCGKSRLYQDSIPVPSSYKSRFYSDLCVSHQDVYQEALPLNLQFNFYASCILYMTDVPLLPSVCFLYILSTNVFNYFSILSLAIFVHSSTKCCIFHNVTLLGS